MKQLFCTVVLGCCLQGTCAQTVISGSVFDFSDHSALPYASIGVEGKTSGTLSDSSGNFSLQVADSVALSDSLTFSFVGFKSSKYKISEIVASAPCSVRLQRNDYEIPEIVVRPGKTKYLKIGRSRAGDGIFSTDFFSPEHNLKGEECGVLLDCQYACRVDRLHFFIQKNGFESLKLRLSFYSVENGWPKDAIVDKDIRFSVSDRYEGWVDLDLSPCDIRLNPGKFAATLTFLEGETANNSKAGLQLPITLLSRYSVVSRDNAQGRWNKDAMMIAFFLDATAFVD